MIGVAVYPEASVSTAKTLLQLYAANANRPLWIREIDFSCQGTSATAAPIKFEVVIQTDAGSGSSAVTPVKGDQTDPHTIECTAARDPTSPQPTTTDVLKSFFIHPQTGRYWQTFDARELRINGGDRIAIRLPDAPGASVDITGHIVFEE